MALPSAAAAAACDGRKTRYRIETRYVSYELPAGNGSSCKAILSRVSCEARPGEILAIAGPSGAGKSTVLSILGGIIPPTCLAEGEVLVNGRKMEAAAFRRVSGYVPQDDVLFPLLTVEESLAYSVRLKIGAGRREAFGRARALLRQLGLAHVAGARVGGNGWSGISGGERRRVSIGVELVHDPAVLLLDEPTSGLDSASAVNVVSKLKAMALAGGKTVALTVHQPGFRILQLIDSVVLIAGGAVRHHGSLSLLEKRLEESGHTVPSHANLLEYAMDVIPTLTVEVGADRLLQNEHENRRKLNSESICRFYANYRSREVGILAERFFKNVLRTKQLFAGRMIQSAIAGVGLGSIFMKVDSQQAIVGFFAFSLTFLLSSTTEGLPILLQERRILMREVSGGAYRVSSYVLANAIVFFPFLFAAALLYAAPVYWLVGLRTEFHAFLFFFLVIWLVMLTANAFVACFSALVPNFIMGNTVIAGFMGSFFLFSGYFISKERIPKYWLFMHYMSLFKYPFEAFLLNEYGGEKGRRECIQRGEGGCVMDGEMFLRRQGMVEDNRWSNLGVMLAFIFGYRLVSLVILWIRTLR